MNCCKGENITAVQRSLNDNLNDYTDSGLGLPTFAILLNRNPN